MLNTINLSLSSMRVSNIRLAFRSLALLLAGIHLFAAISSQSMNADGVSYLDIGDAYFRGDWANAINPVWSPLYSLILGLANFIFKPSMQWQFPVVHIVNLLIFVGTLVCFEFMWNTIKPADVPGVRRDSFALPEPVWWALGYSLFIWVSLALIQIWSVTPDILMGGFIFLAAGLIGRIRRGDRHWRSFLYLGLVLGLGYLSKTFMFSMAVVFLVISFVLARKSKEYYRNNLLAVGMFLLVSLPFIVLISVQKGKITIGEAGTVTYVRHVHEIPYPHWQGDPDRNIAPTHPSRVIHQSPPIYEFGEPIGGTYPISMDPSYWYEGIDIPFDWESQLARLFASSLFYMDLFIQEQGILLAGTLALYFMMQKRRPGFLEIIKRWALVIPAVAAFGLYGMVLVAGRYIGVFVLLFWADILAKIQLPETPNNRSWLNTISMIAVVGLLANIMLFNLDGFDRLNAPSSVMQDEQREARPLEVAAALHQLGVEAGSKVGVIGYAYDSFWARLVGVRIVAELPELQATDFWLGDETLQRSVLQAFASTGAGVVVAEDVPGYVQLPGWHQVGDSNYYIYQFEEHR
jgi:4-amino-4-deoxy-L-arabinose transferase-like glycosyltransferase